MKAMVLAAGTGDRLQPLTATLPKPMLPIAGIPLLEHTVRHLVGHGITEIVINVHHKPEAITGYFGAARFGASITYSHEATLLGTAGAVRKVRDQFHEAFLVVYGDNLSSCRIDRLAAAHRRTGATCTMALFWRDEVRQSGVAELDAADRVTRFLEKPADGETSSRWINAGLLVVEPELLDFVPERPASDFGRDVLPAALRAGRRVQGYRMGEDEQLWWVDTPDAYALVARAWEGHSR